jgi:hypothetical protein
MDKNTGRPRREAAAQDAEASAKVAPAPATPIADLPSRDLLDGMPQAAMNLVRSSTRACVAGTGTLGRCYLELAAGLAEQSTQAMAALGAARTPADLAAAGTVYVTAAAGVVLVGTTRAQQLAAQTFSDLLAKQRGAMALRLHVDEA